MEIHVNIFFKFLAQSQFGSLMNCELFEPLRSKFCSVHISVPGMEASDAAVQAGCYPTMDQMAEMIPYVSCQRVLKY